MKSLLKLGLFSALLALASFAFAGDAVRGERSKSAASVRIAATIYGQFDPVAMAWVGYALVQLGDRPATIATVVDRGTSLQLGDNGAFSGTETLTLTFLDGSGTFDILGVYDAEPATTPFLCYLTESGTVENGTGVFAQISGLVVIKGPFLHPILNPATGLNDPRFRS